MSGQRSRFDAAELDDLKAGKPLSALFADAGHKVRGGVCLCPFHPEKTASCTVDDRKGFFFCFGCDAHGDHIDFLMQDRGVGFVDAVEMLGGVRELPPADRARIEQRRREADEKGLQETQRQRSRAEQMFDAGRPIAGTLAAAYLAARGLRAVPSTTFDLRFAPAIRYRGFANDYADEQVALGEFPAMLAAIRDVEGALIGVHRTYLSPDRPEKLTPPGDRRRNAAKKVYGEQRGGMIRLSAPSAHLALGEGIETTLSWFAMGLCADDGVSIAAAVSLGNLAGGSVARIPHPTQEGRRIPNGEPDPEQPGLLLPPAVREVTLLGDGDSDKATTAARLMVAGRRFRAQGRKVFVAMAPDGHDFNDVLVAENEAAA